MWTKRKADPVLVQTVREIVFMNQHKNLTENMMIRLMPETDPYFILDALAEARDLGYIYCTSGRWAIRGVHNERAVKKAVSPNDETTPSGVTKRSVHNERYERVPYPIKMERKR